MRKLLKIGSILTAGFLCSSSSVVQAFGPYEQILAHGKDLHVGLIAAAKQGREADLDKSLKCLVCDKCARELKKAGISNVVANRKTLADKKTWYWVYFRFQGEGLSQGRQRFREGCRIRVGIC